jgi:hypothetical protein
VLRTRLASNYPAADGTFPYPEEILNMMNPFGLGLLAVMTTASLGLTQANDSGGESNTAEATSFLQGVSMAPGEGITFDGGDEFSLNLRNLLQLDYTYVEPDTTPTGSNSSFGVTRARTYLSGHLFDPTVTYLMSMEWTEPGATTSPSPLKDAWIQWEFWGDEDNGVTLRTGQSKTMFGRQATNFEGYLELPMRQLATNTFSTARSRGAWLGGRHINDTLHWNAGVQNGDVAAANLLAIEEAPNTDHRMSFVANVRWENVDMGGEWASEGDLEHVEEVQFGFGGGFFFGNGLAQTESTSYTLNGVLKTNGFYVNGEWFGRTDEPVGAADQDSDGWQLEGSWTTAPNTTQYGFVLGVSQISLDQVNTTLTATPLGAGTGEVLQVSVGVDMYYHAHNLKTEVAYVYQDVDFDAGMGADVKTDFFIVQVSLLF